MIRPARRGLGVWAAWLGLGVLLVTAIWWWLVFRTLLGSAALSVPGALPCLVERSVVCRLAQALCTSDQFLGIRRYDVEIFWIGAGLLVMGLAMLRLTPARGG